MFLQGVFSPLEFSPAAGEFAAPQAFEAVGELEPPPPNPPRSPALKAFADRLEAAGKPAKVVLIAVARKLLVIANALLRDNKPWRDLTANSVAVA